MPDILMNSQIQLCPSQLEITFSEDCNQRCDYCWVHKSCFKKLKFSAAKKGIDIFLDLPLKERTITFTTSEPLLYPELYKKILDYILSKNNSGKINIITTTNGLNLNGDIKSYIIKVLNKYTNFRLNISLDGNKKSHDAHRKLARLKNGSAFDISWDNFKDLPRDKVRVIFTVTPEEVDFFEDNIGFIINNGFVNIDIFPQVFTTWPKNKLKALAVKLSRFIENINMDIVKASNLRVLNRLWGTSHYAKLLLAPDDNFYLFEWVEALPYPKRKSYIVGNVKKGIELNKRADFFNVLFREATVKSSGKCLKCNFKNICSLPLPLYIWSKYHKNDFNKNLSNFCNIADVFINLSEKIKNDKRNELDSKKVNLRLKNG